MRVKVGKGSRVVIPVKVRRELGIDAGDQFVLRVDSGEMRLLSISDAIRRAQELVAQYVPKGESLVDSLLAERSAGSERGSNDRQLPA